MKVHVHIYEVVKKGEITLEVKNEEEAKEAALDLASKGLLPFDESDCEFIALAFKEK